MWGYPYWAAYILRKGFSLTEHTEFTEHFGAQFRAHRRPPAYRVHRALLLKVAVRFCDICRPQGLCGMLCVLFFCVNLWEIERTLSMRLGLWDLLGSFFSHRAHRVHWAFWRTFRAHRTPPAYRVHRALLLKVAVRFCEIGWLNVSVECCVFCSSVFFCERKNNCETRWGGFSLTEHTEFTEHFGAQFRAHRRPSAYREHRALLPKMGVGCWVLGVDE